MADAIIAAKGGVIVTPEYAREGVRYVEVRCTEGHTWTPRVANLIYCDSWCPDCYGNRPCKIEDLHEWAGEMGGLCLSDEYSGNKTKYSWECGQCAHQWEATWYNVKGHSSWCPECKTSIRETIVRAAFRENFPGDVFNKDRKTIGMELDGYSEENCLAFEHDGLQHRVHVPHFQRGDGDFEAQLARDARKDELCDEAGITLIRVPDRRLLPHSKIRGYVREAIIDLGYVVPGDLSDDKVFFASIRATRGASRYFDEAKRIVTDQGGELLAESCPTRTWPLHARCCNGHEFETHFDNLERGRGCIRCTDTMPKEDIDLEDEATRRGYEFLYTENRHGADKRSRRYVTLQCPNGHEPVEMMWDNFRAGRGCEACGRVRAGTTKRNTKTNIEERLQAVGLAIETEYEGLNKPLIFVCQAGHRFTSTLKKVEMAPADARCPPCTALLFDDVLLLDPYSPDTDPARTKLRWRCRICEKETSTTFRGMRIRKHRCVNENCPGRG